MSEVCKFMCEKCMPSGRCICVIDIMRTGRLDVFPQKCHLGGDFPVPEWKVLERI